MSGEQLLTMTASDSQQSVGFASYQLIEGDLCASLRRRVEVLSAENIDGERYRVRGRKRTPLAFLATYAVPSDVDIDAADDLWADFQGHMVDALVFVADDGLRRFDSALVEVMETVPGSRGPALIGFGAVDGSSHSLQVYIRLRVPKDL